MRRVTSFFFLATIFCCTFEKVHWSFGGSIELSDILAFAFLISFAILMRPVFPRTAVTLIAFFAAFLLVYLIGFFNLDSTQAVSQFAKGMIKFLIHFSFVVAAVAWLFHRGKPYYWRTLRWFCGGIAFNGAYGILQLLVARGGGNLDSYFVEPLTRGASQINIYGIVEGAKIYRANALTGDPNHLGVMLIVPILILSPIYLRMARGSRDKRRLGWLIAFLLICEISTLSRSGLLGLGVGALVLVSPYRRYLRSSAFLLPLVAVALVLAAVVVTRLHYFEVLFKSRTQTSGGSESAHLHVYSFVPAILHSHPLFGLGLNNFSVYYEFVTGLSNWGPHSYYVSLIVETGVVGTALYAVFLFWVYARLRVARRLGRYLTEIRDPLGPLVLPLSWGMTAALTGTLASNIFYLTMQFYYFYAFIALAVAVPVVFGREEPARVPSVAPVRGPLAPVSPRPAAATPLEPTGS